MWLLESSVKDKIENAVNAGLSPTVAQQETHINALTSRELIIVGGVARIPIEGVITDKPDFLAFLFAGGNTLHSNIVSALAEADANPLVKKISLIMDTPGGTVDGLFNTIAAIQRTSKPITAEVLNIAASAGFAIAAQADTIVAQNSATRVGSIGVAASFFVSRNVVDIASTAAPKKRPDVSTAEGVAIVREELDALHDLFVESIAEGRNTTKERINQEFGQGGIFLADEALKRGMIDSIATPTLRVVETKLRVKNMNAGELLANHPDTHAELVQLGADQERDRVTAHLTLGQNSGDMVTALAAIEDGSAMTATLQAKYMTAGMNKSSIEARKADDANTVNAVAGAAGSGETGDEADLVADLVCQSLGYVGG